MGKFLFFKPSTGCQKVFWGSFSSCFLQCGNDASFIYFSPTSERSWFSHNKKKATRFLISSSYLAGDLRVHNRFWIFPSSADSRAFFPLPPHGCCRKLPITPERNVNVTFSRATTCRRPIVRVLPKMSPLQSRRFGFTFSLVSFIIHWTPSRHIIRCVMKSQDLLWLVSSHPWGRSETGNTLIYMRKHWWSTSLSDWLSTFQAEVIWALITDKCTGDGEKAHRMLQRCESTSITPKHVYQ